MAGGLRGVPKSDEATDVKITPVPAIGLSSGTVQEVAEELQTEINVNTINSSLLQRWLNVIQ